MKTKAKPKRRSSLAIPKPSLANSKVPQVKQPKLKVSYINKVKSLVKQKQQLDKTQDKLTQKIMAKGSSANIVNSSDSRKEDKLTQTKARSDMIKTQLIQLVNNPEFR